MWWLRQVAFAFFTLLLADTASAGSNAQVAPARRQLSPGLAAPTPLALLQPRQDPSRGGGGGGDNQAAQQQQQQQQQQLQQQQQQQQQQIQQLSESFSSRLAQVTQQASQSLQQLQQSVQSIQQSAQSSADSAIASVRSSAESQARQAGSSASSALASAQAAASSNTCPTCATCPSCQDAQGAPAATVTAFATVTATVTVGSDNSGTGAPEAAAAALPAQSCTVDSNQANGKQQEIQPVPGFDTCTTTGKALAIIGLVMGLVGLSSLGFILWNMRRRRTAAETASFRLESPRVGNDISSPLSSEKVEPKAGLIDRFRNGAPMNFLNSNSRPASPEDDYGDTKTSRPTRTRAPLKESISKPIRLSMWPWRRNSDRLSFQDIGGPTLPMTNNRGGYR